MKPTRIAYLTAFISFLVAAFVGWTPGSAWAPPTVESHFGSVGVASSETASINVVSLHPPDPCHVNVVWLNTEGQVLQQRDFVVGPGQTRSDTLRAETVGRNQIRVVVEWLPPPLPPDPCRAQSLLTLEIVDNATGRTLILYPHSQGRP